MAFYNDLKLHLQAGVPAMYVESSEWLRFERDVAQCCKDTEKRLFLWNPLNGLDGDEMHFSSVVDRLRDTKDEHAVFVLEFADRYLMDSDHEASRFAAMVRGLREKHNHVIIFSPSLAMPEVVKSEFAMLDFPLPGHEDIRTIQKLVGQAHELDDAKIDTADAIVNSVRGLGATEIWNAFAKAAVRHGKITAEQKPELVAEKEQIIRKSGYLEFVRTEKTDMEKIGGLESLKEWLKTRKKGFGNKARAAGLSAPKGVLLLGIPGTGKSLCAKVVAHEWEMPLLRLDMGRVFGGLVGESESNMRSAIKVAEGLAPCVLWIDEIEKGVSGGAGASGERDGGTAVRVFGAFLTWMQEKEEDVFVFATANDLSRLPPELLRKGRFDEIFFTDLPGKDARKRIFDIHLRSRGQELKPTCELVKTTEGFSGSEIEAVVNEALFLAYKEGEELRVSAADLAKAAQPIVPLSETMGEDIEKLRKWAKARCRPASEEEPPTVSIKGGPRLRAESNNPFINDNG